MNLEAIVMAARLAASVNFSWDDIPSTPVVLAIISHETRGNPRLCVNESDGSSSRGLLQLNHKNSRCSPEDNARFHEDFWPASNIRRGVALLAFQAKWCRERCHGKHDELRHFAGKGAAADRFAADIRRMAVLIASRGEDDAVKP